MSFVDLKKRFMKIQDRAFLDQWNAAKKNNETNNAIKLAIRTGKSITASLVKAMKRRIPSEIPNKVRKLISQRLSIDRESYDASTCTIIAFWLTKLDGCKKTLLVVNDNTGATATMIMNANIKINKEAKLNDDFDFHIFGMCSSAFRNLYSNKTIWDDEQVIRVHDRLNAPSSEGYDLKNDIFVELYDDSLTVRKLLNHLNPSIVIFAGIQSKIESLLTLYEILNNADIDWFLCTERHQLVWYDYLNKQFSRKVVNEATIINSGGKPYETKYSLLAYNRNDHAKIPGLLATLYEDIEDNLKICHQEDKKADASSPDYIYYRQLLELVVTFTDSGNRADVKRLNPRYVVVNFSEEYDLQSVSFPDFHGASKKEILKMSLEQINTFIDWRKLNTSLQVARKNTSKRSTSKEASMTGCIDETYSQLRVKKLVKKVRDYYYNSSARKEILINIPRPTDTPESYVPPQRKSLIDNFNYTINVSTMGTLEDAEDAWHLYELNRSTRIKEYSGSSESESESESTDSIVAAINCQPSSSDSKISGLEINNTKRKHRSSSSSSNSNSSSSDSNSSESESESESADAMAAATNDQLKINNTKRKRGNSSSSSSSSSSS